MISYSKYYVSIVSLVLVLSIILMLFQNLIIVECSDQVESFYIGEHRVFLGRQIPPYKIEDVPGLNIVITDPLPKNDWCYCCIEVVPFSNLTIEDLRKLDEIREEMVTLLDKAYNEIGVDARIYTVEKLPSGEYLLVIGLINLDNNTIKRLVKYIDENMNLSNVAFSFYRMFTPRSKYDKYVNTSLKLYRVLDKIYNYHNGQTGVKLSDTEQELYKLILKLTNDDFRGYGVSYINPDYILTIFIQTNNEPDMGTIVEFTRFIREHYVEPDLPIRLIIGNLNMTLDIKYAKDTGESMNINPFYYTLIPIALVTIVSYYVFRHRKQST